MSNALLRGLVAMLLIGPLLSQTDQLEPFSFKDDRLGMSLEAFKAKHLSPGRWEDEATKTMYPRGDPHSAPRGKGRWKWEPYLDCKEPFKGVITRCEYTTTVAEIPSVHVAGVFVDGKLAVITVWYGTHSPLMQQALVDKLGSPARIAVSGTSNRDLSAMRWDDGVSLVEFQEHYCGSGSGTYNLSQQGWSIDVTEVLRGSYCENGDTGDYGSAVIWYVHKSLSNLAIAQWKEAIEEVKKKATSEQFNFDDQLGMSLKDFKAKHSNPGHGKTEATRTGRTPDMPCKETTNAITECKLSPTILGINVFAKAIFVDQKLAAIHLYYLYSASRSAVISGVLVPVDIKQALIDRFGAPEIIRGDGDSALTGDDRRALHWEDGVAVLEYQGNNCGGGNEYEKITKILLRRYCEKTDSGDGTVSILYISKALSGQLMTRWKEAQDNARQKARSEM